jgi:long-chain acyl-CoA synthetase
VAATVGVPLPGDEAARCQHPAVRELLERRIRAALAELSNWEQVRRFAVLPRPFSVAEDELTPTLKLRRGVVLKKYAALVDAMYRD